MFGIFDKASDKQPPLLDSLRAAVRAAKDDFSEIVSAVTTQGLSGEISTHIRETCLDHLDYIGVTAEQSQLPGMRCVCGAIYNHLQSVSDLTPNFAHSHGQAMVQWADDVLAYLEHVDDKVLAEKLLAPLPQDKRHGLLQALTLGILAPIQAQEGANRDEADESTQASNDATDAAASPAETESTSSAVCDTAPELFSEPANDDMMELKLSETNQEMTEQDKNDNQDETMNTIEQLDSADDPDTALTQEIKHQPEVQQEQLDEVSDDSSAESVSTDGVNDSADAALLVDERLVVFGGELQEIATQLSSFLDTIINADNEDMALLDGVSEYSELTERAIAASDALGLYGLRDVCSFISDNLIIIASLEVSARRELRKLLESWPQLVLAYLKTPTDEQTCLYLVEHLQDTGWPEPLSGTKGRDLFAALSEGIGESIESEDSEVRQSVAEASDVALEISGDINQELVDAFFQESPIHAADFTARVQQIASGKDVLENVEAAQRLTHTLKGSANLIGAKGIANLTHHLEDILEYLSKHQVAPPLALANTLQEAADCVETMIDALRGMDTAPQDALKILQAVLDWANRIDQGQIDLSVEQARPAFEKNENDIAPLPENSQELVDVQPFEPDQAEQPHQPQPTSTETLQVPITTVDEMFRMVGEVSIAMSQIQEHVKRLISRGENLRHQDGSVQLRRFELENLVDVRNIAAMQRRLHNIGASRQSFDPLELDQYDELYGATHSFIESVADSREIAQRLQSELLNLDGLFVHQQRLNKGLQQVIMTVRMIPIRTIESRLQRSVRQACRATGKQAELEILGTDMLLDKEVLSKLADPLMHILRNAVDHGIESPEQREQLGKPVTGEIKLRFRQEGNNVLVDCADDGRGLDYGRIRETAIDKGLLDEQEMPEQHELARIILLPGFSTRTSATQISGRGVGMNVVHNAISGLKGTMEIAENEPSGCLFTLRLPISLVTSHCLVVAIDNEVFAIPTTSLIQILAPGMGEVKQEDDETIYLFGEESYPLKSAASLLNANKSEQTEGNNTMTVLLVRADTGVVAISVDRVVSSYDLVVKNLGRYVKTVHGVSGVSVLGDGRVLAVLDVPQLLRVPVRSDLLSADEDSTSGKQAKLDVPQVLIVDDSLSMRKSLSLIARDVPYEYLLARDGLEAVDILQKNKVDIVLADLEMPRMNGLELSRHIRANRETRDLPIIMITSRSMQKHRQQAEKAGVNVYLTKPFLDDELLETIDSLLNPSDRLRA